MDLNTHLFFIAFLRALVEEATKRLRRIQKKINKAEQLKRDQLRQRILREWHEKFEGNEAREENGHSHFCNKFYRNVVHSAREVILHYPYYLN